MIAAVTPSVTTGISAPSALTSSGTATNVSRLLSGPAATGSSASISGFAQLLGNLQQLQTQNPAAFQRTVTQIASQLQTAAKQQQGPESQYLSNLAAKFENIANGGNLSQLQPHHHGHHQHSAQTYNSAGQATAQGISDGIPSSSSSQLQSLFASLNTQVTQALTT